VGPAAAARVGIVAAPAAQLDVGTRLRRAESDHREQRSRRDTHDPHGATISAAELAGELPGPTCYIPAR
jgi:hypothetical protein